MPLIRCLKNGQLGYKWGQSGKCYVGPNARGLALRQSRAIKASQSGQTDNLLVANQTGKVNPLLNDPTRTTVLRNRFQVDIRRRFRRLAKAIDDLIVKEDAFGLKQPISPRQFLRNANDLFFSDLLVNTRWSFLDDGDKLREFTNWLSEQVGKEIIPEDDRYWEQYVQEGFERGAGQAFDNVKKPLLAVTERQRDVFKGARRQFLGSTLNAPESVEKVKILLGRVLSEFEGLADEVRNRLARDLSDGLVQGDNPITIVRRIKQSLGTTVRRAQTIARTEVVRAHAEGSLNALEQLGVEELSVMVEHSTAGDSRVCPLCVPLDGIVISIKKASGMIPRHPNCRCAWVPANVGESIKDQKRSKSSIAKAVERSVKAEVSAKDRSGSRRTLKDRKRLSSWVGSKRKFPKASKGLI